MLHDVVSICHCSKVDLGPCESPLISPTHSVSAQRRGHSFGGHSLYIIIHFVTAQRRGHWETHSFPGSSIPNSLQAVSAQWREYWFGGDTVFAKAISTSHSVSTSDWRGHSFGGDKIFFRKLLNDMDIGGHRVFPEAIPPTHSILAQQLCIYQRVKSWKTRVGWWRNWQFRRKPRHFWCRGRQRLQTEHKMSALL